MDRTQIYMDMGGVGLRDGMGTGIYKIDKSGHGFLGVWDNSRTRDISPNEDLLFLSACFGCLGLLLIPAWSVCAVSQVGSCFCYLFFYPSLNILTHLAGFLCFFWFLDKKGLVWCIIHQIRYGDEGDFLRMR